MVDMDFSSDPELLGSFVVEGREHVEIIEQELLAAESGPENSLEIIDTLFRSFHTIKGTSTFLSLNDFNRVAAAGEQLLEEHRHDERPLEQRQISLLLAAGDLFKSMLDALEEVLANGETDVPDNDGVDAICEQLLGSLQHAPSTSDEVPAQPGSVFIAAVNDDDNDAGGSVADAGEIEYDEDEYSPDPVPAGRSEIKRVDRNGDQPKPQPGARKLKLQDETLRVSTAVLDQLIDTIGELVVAEAMVVQAYGASAAESSNDGLLSQLTKITRELQELGTTLRMVPIAPVFRRMARVVRDLSLKLDRPVRLETDGEETQLDKSVVDLIAEPLLHMVRNAIDHGIEDAETRRAAGKPVEACIRLSARHRGGNIHIEISDDGQGINREKVRQKAIDRGIITPDQQLSSRDTYDLLFAPGFSTAEEITDVSGRGVGMDVVKKEIQRLRGIVDVQSEDGVGTTFSMRLPLTLAIIDGMVVRSGAERYVIPILSILTSIQPHKEAIHTVLKHGKMLTHQDELIPLFSLRHLFDIKDAKREIAESIVVILEEDGRRVAVQVDELLGQQQIVIKSVSADGMHAPGIAGAAVMPDGLVGLILDVPGLMRMAVGLSEQSGETPTGVAS